jgi:hypothetical protein
MEKKHLSRVTQEFLDTCKKGDDQKRILRILSDTWINYGAANDIVETSNRMIAQNSGIRPQSLLIVGDPQNGKSSIRVRIESTHHEIIDNHGKIRRPVVSFVMPVEPDIRAIVNAILNAMFLPEHSGRPEQALRHCYKNLSEFQVKLLLIDEFHHIGRIPIKKQRIILDAIKNISSIAQLPIIAFGTEEAAQMLSSDVQLHSRFNKVNLPIWRTDDELIRLLTSIELILPLGEPSNLIDHTIAMEIYEKTNGTIGEIIRLLQECAVTAIASEQENITLEMVRTIKFHTSKSKILS